MSGTVTLALAGNPNAGKTSIFNALTGSRHHVGNWPGKTVAKVEGTFRHGDVVGRLVDLP
ncbi:MAG: FeoB small GTPase domain-containing protein, partial [Chloroflexota bacterium]